jgi:predicted HAD superfamily Cof-like phosphohydrolase
MTATLTRGDAVELLDALQVALAAIDAGEPIAKAMLEPAVALAEQLLATADSDPRTGPSAMAVMVAEFHEHANSTGRAATVALTPSLHAEEHDELLEAIERDDAAAIARELADVAYIAFSEAWARGLDLDAAFLEVHRAAIDKIAVNRRDPAGKLTKPPGFRPPDMTAATARAVADHTGRREAAAAARALRRASTTLGTPR